MKYQMQDELSSAEWKYEFNKLFRKMKIIMESKNLVQL